MTKVYDTAYFIERARKIHGDRYDYSKTEYKKADERLVITCRAHGEFYQFASKHLRGSGCRKCCGKAKKTTKEFIEDARLVHGDRYDYSLVDYKAGKYKVIIICQKHGEFEQQPARHLSGQGCPNCSRSKQMDTEGFVTRAKQVHGNTYSYRKVSYVNSKTPVTIVCSAHGEFTQAPNKHLQKQGCPKCSRALMGRGVDCFERICNEGDSSEPKLYVMQCYSKSESFYKVGITSRGIKERYTGRVHMPYDYDVLHEVLGDGRFIYELERSIKSILRGYKFEPSKKFGGYTECFSTIKPVENLLKRISTTKQLQLLA